MTYLASYKYLPGSQDPVPSAVQTALKAKIPLKAPAFMHCLVTWPHHLRSMPIANHHEDGQAQSSAISTTSSELTRPPTVREVHGCPGVGPQ